MGILKKLFGKKQKEELKVQEEQVKEEPKPEPKEQVKMQEGLPVCNQCGMKIDKELHGQRTFEGKKFHKKCFRQIKQGAKKQAFG